MKLQENTSRTRKTKKFGKREYKKYLIVIPNEVIEILKWNSGNELQYKVKDGKLIIQK